MSKNQTMQNIPVVILAGGLGTRIAENKGNLPKGLVEIGKYPIIFHIINYFKSYGSKSFIICTGYKENLIKYFINNKKLFKNLDIKIVSTGKKSNTGLRVKKKIFIKDIFPQRWFNQSYLRKLLKFFLNKKLVS